MPLSTMLLNPSTWDLLVDASKNIALAAPPYAYAQDAASAIKLFEDEDYYDTSRGVPYWQDILGHWPPVTLMKAHWIAAALTVPDVVQAQCFIDSIEDRRPSGQVQVTSASGEVAAVSFKPPLPTPFFPAPSGSSPSLDFSQPSNSQFLPLIG